MSLGTRPSMGQHPASSQGPAPTSEPGISPSTDSRAGPPALSVETLLDYAGDTPEGSASPQPSCQMLRGRRGLQSVHVVLSGSGDQGTKGSHEKGLAL